MLAWHLLNVLLHDLADQTNMTMHILEHDTSGEVSMPKPMQMPKSPVPQDATIHNISRQQAGQ